MPELFPVTKLFHLSVFIGLWVCPLITFAQQPDHQSTQPVRPAVKLAELSVATSASVCARCHSGGRVTEQPKLIRHDEFDTWQSHDPHRRAFDELKSERSRAIGQRLYGDAEVIGNSQCLACHATDSQLKPTDPGFAINTEGVSCVTCHGSSRDWIIEHALGDDQAWMSRPAHEKSSKFGMTDLREPGTRSRLCLSCHRGDHSQKKVITHAMYAAGHPPLSAIDLTDASQLFPKHWLESRETPYILQAKPDVQRDGYHFTPGDFSIVHKVSRGAIASLEAEVREFGSWDRSVDFARYDCTSCHRELKAFGVTDWRERANSRFTRELTLSPLWPARVLQILQNEGGLDTEIDQEIAVFLTARRVPFKDVDLSKLKKGQFARWVEQKGRTPANSQRARAFLREICDLGQSEIIDFDSARQISWSAWSIITELKLSAAPAIHSLFTTLDRELDLSLFTSELELKAGVSRDWIKARENFDPTRVRAQFASLLEKIP